METNEILALYEHDERQQLAIPGMRRERDRSFVRLVMEVEEEGKSFVSYSALNEENVDAEIARQVDYFGELKRSFEWTVYDYDRPHDLGARLAARGFDGEETSSLMVLELDQASPLLLAPPTAVVLKLDDPAQLESVRRLLAAVWDNEFTWFIPRMERFMATEGSMSIFLATVDGEPASTAWIFFPEGSRFAGLYGGSTLEKYRGRGLYTALVAARAQEAVRRGYQFLLIDAGDMSRPIVEKQGFRLLARNTPYVMDNG